MNTIVPSAHAADSVGRSQLGRAHVLLLEDRIGRGAPADPLTADSSPQQPDARAASAAARLCGVGNQRRLAVGSSSDGDIDVLR